MTFSKERFNSCVTEAKRCMKDRIETEYDRAIFWANERIKEFTNQPTAQPTETCKGWGYTFYGAEMINPHNGCKFSSFQVDYCPTCGLRIEVVE